jgi:hypothetical protein
MDVVEAEQGSLLDQNNDLCAKCGMGGDLLCCDTCPKSFHIRCAGLGKGGIPSGDWSCEYCTTNTQLSTGVNTGETAQAATELDARGLGTLLRYLELTCPREQIGEAVRSVVRFRARFSDAGVLRGLGSSAGAAGGAAVVGEDGSAAAPLALLMLHIGRVVGAGRLRATMLRIDRNPSTPDGFSICDRRFVTCAACRSWGVLRTFCFTCGARVELGAGDLAPVVPRCGQHVKRLRKRVNKYAPPPAAVAAVAVAALASAAVAATTVVAAATATAVAAAAAAAAPLASASAETAASVALGGGATLATAASTSAAGLVPGATGSAYPAAVAVAAATATTAACAAARVEPAGKGDIDLLKLRAGAVKRGINYFRTCISEPGVFEEYGGDILFLTRNLAVAVPEEFREETNQLLDQTARRWMREHPHLSDDTDMAAILTTIEALHALKQLGYCDGKAGDDPAAEAEAAAAAATEPEKSSDGGEHEQPRSRKLKRQCAAKGRGSDDKFLLETMLSEIKSALLNFDITDVFGFNPVEGKVPMTPPEQCSHCSEVNLRGKKRWVLR